MGDWGIVILCESCEPSRVCSGLAVIHVIWWMFCSTGVIPLGVIPPASAIAGLKLPNYQETVEQETPLTQGTTEKLQRLRRPQVTASLQPHSRWARSFLQYPVDWCRRSSVVMMWTWPSYSVITWSWSAEKPHTSHRLGLGIQPRRQEVPDLISWVQCFSVCAAIVSAKHADRICQLLAY